MLDLAATTAALVALAHAAARAPGLRQLKITVMPANARGGQGVVRDQHASALLARVMAALRATLAANGMLRCAWAMLIRVSGCAMATLQATRAASGMLRCAWMIPVEALWYHAVSARIAPGVRKVVQGLVCVMLLTISSLLCCCLTSHVENT